MTTFSRDLQRFEQREQWSWVPVLAVVIVFLQECQLSLGLIPSDGRCGLSIFVAFTTILNANVDYRVLVDDDDDDHDSNGRGGAEPVLTPIKMASEAIELSSILTTSKQNHSLGFFHMAAGVMAMDDFNARNPSIVPQLRSDDVIGECSIQLDFNQSYFIDTSTLAHIATTEFIHDIRRKNNNNASPSLPLFPCALAGPFDDLAAQNMATLAAASKIPHIPHRGYNFRISDPFYSPYTSQIFPDMILIGEALGHYLQHIGRNKYIIVLNTALSDTGIQRGEGIGIGMAKVGVKISESHTYATPQSYLKVPKDRSIFETLVRVKERGYRTIVVAMDLYYVELPYIADAAEILGMNNGDYVWIFHPNFEMEAIHNLLQASPQVLQQRGLPSYENVIKLLKGSALIQPVEPHQYLGEKSDPFWKAWKNKDATFVKRLNDYAIHNSIQNVDGYTEQAKDDFFQTNPPQLGTSFLYDAIMSIGVGACIAQRKQQIRNSNQDTTTTTNTTSTTINNNIIINNNKTVEAAAEISGASHVKGIHSSNFAGASGQLSFDRRSFQNTRDGRTATIGIFNLYPPSRMTLNNHKHGGTIDDSDGNSLTNLTRSFQDAFVLTEIIQQIRGTKKDKPDGRGGGKGGGGKTPKWTQAGPKFVYANGQTVPTELLRDTPEQNYLSRGFRIAGVTLMAMTIASALACMIWIVLHRDCRVVRASQPSFLVLLLVGAMVGSLAILSSSFDETLGWSTEKLSRVCMSGPWNFAVGYQIIYGSLFTKLWRLNKVLQFKRQKINTNAVAGPMFVLIILTITLLTVWTIVDPLEWQRIEIDETTGESVGRCDCDSEEIFLPLLLMLCFIPTLLTCLMAWKTRDVDDIYSESSWIFTLVVLQIQVLVVGIPIAFLLSDISTNLQYLGITLILFTIPNSVIMLIIVPKIVRHYKELRYGDTTKTLRGARAGVVVSGMSHVGNSIKNPDPRTSSIVDPHANEIRNSVTTNGPRISDGFSHSNANTAYTKFNNSYQIDFNHQGSQSDEDSEKRDETQDGPSFHGNKESETVK